MKPDIRQFHDLSEGNIESIGLLFSEMARQPLPPQVICKILGMNEEDVKAAFEAGKPPTANLAMLEDAVLKSVDPGDTLDMYEPVFKRHIERFKNSASIMQALRPSLKEFWSKVDGSTAKIEKFFADLAPEPQKGKPMPEGMINALLRIDAGVTRCEQEDFLGCFERNLDISDTAAAIQAVLDKHLA